MRETIGRFTVAGLVVVGMLCTGVARGQSIDEALTFGDQLLFFYDTTTNRTTFLMVGNTNRDPIVVEVTFYSQDLNSRVGEDVMTIEAFGARVIDPLLVDGVSGNAGLVTVTPIVNQVDHTPVIHARPLTGGFTLVNVSLGAGFGQNPFGRLAVAQGAGTRPTTLVGNTTVVDGTAVAYQEITPPTSPRPVTLSEAPSLTVPVYFNPQTLSPVANDGNRLYMVSFQDQYAAGVGPDGAARFNVTPQNVLVTYCFFDQTGNLFFVDSFALSGVVFNDLQSLAGVVPLIAPGRLEFLITPPGGTNIFGLFSQALGTFAVGQRLPPIDFE